MDGLLREIELDRANGLLGKTCIHPSHVLPVHALSVVSHEEFSDAAGHPAPGARRRRGPALGVHEQDERGEAAPRLGRAHPAARRGLRRRDEDIGFVELLAAGLPG